MFDIDKFVEDVKRVSEKKNCVIVAVSEGAKIDKDTYVCEALSKGETDAFGHKHLSGTARVLADIVGERLGLKTRQIEFGLLQRCAAHSASATDIAESRMIGARADVYKRQGYGSAFGHALGHGVGVQIHEEPRLSARSAQILADNMVVTVEPGIYLRCV